MAVNFKNYTRVQLTNRAKKNIKRLETLSNNSRKVQGKTPAQQRRAIQTEQRQIAKALRQHMLDQFDKRIATVKARIAKQKGISVNSPKATNAKVKLLQQKRRQFSSVSKIETLLERLKGFRMPSITTSSRKTTTSHRKTVAKKAQTRRSTTTSRKRTTTKRSQIKRTSTTSRKKIATRKPQAKRKATTSRRKQTATRTVSQQRYNTLKKQNAQLKQQHLVLKKQNDFMQAQVLRLRRQVETMERHYGNFNKKVYGEFSTHSERHEKIRKQFLELNKISRSRQLTPEQKLNRISKRFERIKSLLTPASNNVIHWPLQSNKNVKQDLNNILKSSRQMFRKR